MAINVGLYRLEKWRFSLRYYLERPLSQLQDSGDVNDFFGKSQRGYMLMLDEDFARLRSEGVKLRAVSERRRGDRHDRAAAFVSRSGARSWSRTVDDTPRTSDPAVR